MADTPRADWQVMTQAIVLANEEGYGAPAFLTDLVKGFRCWIVVDRVLFRFHSSKNGWLTLVEGTALIRYFIVNHGRMASADAKLMLRIHGISACGTSSSRGGTFAREGGDGGSAASSPAPHVGAASLPSSAQRWAGGGAHTRTCSGADSAVGCRDVSPSPPSSSPLGSEQVAVHQWAAIEEFSARLDSVRGRLPFTDLSDSS